MEVPEHVETGATSPIVQLTLCQHSKECGLACIHTSHDCHTHLNVVLIIWDLHHISVWSHDVNLQLTYWNTGSKQYTTNYNN